MSKYVYINNKLIPERIKNEITTALSYFPELKNTKIEFRFKEGMTKSFMLAQPKFTSLFRSRNKRTFVILMSRNFSVDGTNLPIEDIPYDVLIGWIGHELGHIMDYRNRSTLNLLWFGLRYITSQSYIREAERIADTYAVTHKMEDYILATKKFIINNGNLPEAYKDKIKRLYLSPDEILLLVKEQVTH